MVINNYYNNIVKAEQQQSTMVLAMGKLFRKMIPECIPGVSPLESPRARGSTSNMAYIPIYPAIIPYMPYYRTL